MQLSDRMGSFGLNGEMGEGVVTVLPPKKYKMPGSASVVQTHSNRNRNCYSSKICYCEDLHTL